MRHFQPIFWRHEELKMQHTDYVQIIFVCNICICIFFWTVCFYLYYINFYSCILLFVARLLLCRSTTVNFLRRHATKKNFRLSFAQKSGGSHLQKSERNPWKYSWLMILRSNWLPLLYSEHMIWTLANPRYITRKLLNTYIFFVEDKSSSRNNNKVNKVYYVDAVL